MPVYVECPAQLTEQDRQDLLKVYADAPEWLLPPFAAGAALIEQCLADGSLRVARFNGRLLGAARLQPVGDFLRLSHLCVRALTRGRGVARRLVDVPGLTVLTNSVPVADIFYRAERPDVTVVLTGGQRTPSDALVGPIAAASIKALHPDLLFLGVHGISERAGLTTPNLMEAEIDRALVAAANTVMHHHKHDVEAAHALACCPALSQSWRDSLRRRAATDGHHDR